MSRGLQRTDAALRAKTAINEDTPGTRASLLAKAVQANQDLARFIYAPTPRKEYCDYLPGSKISAYEQPKLPGTIILSAELIHSRMNKCFSQESVEFLIAMYHSPLRDRVTAALKVYQSDKTLDIALLKEIFRAYREICPSLPASSFNEAFILSAFNSITRHQVEPKSSVADSVSTFKPIRIEVADVPATTLTGSSKDFSPS